MQERDAHPDLMLFCSTFDGGIARKFFAFDARCYFVSSCGYHCPGEIITPLGECKMATSNYTSYCTSEINLDYAVVHLDFNTRKLSAAKEKYGSLLDIRDPGYVGVVMLTYHGTDRTVQDIIDEFEIERVSDYFARSRAHRELVLPQK